MSADKVASITDPLAQYIAATQGLAFTKDFRALDAVIQDRLATAGERVYAWIRRRAWGNWRLYCADDKGNPVYQRDCAKELGLDKGTVSNTIKYLVSRGYVGTKRRLIYPVLTPVLGDQVNTPRKLWTSTTFRLFFANWKESHSTEVAEYEVADATIKRIKKVVFSDYKRLLRSTTKQPATLYEIERLKQKTAATTAAVSIGPVAVVETPKAEEVQEARVVEPPEVQTAENGEIDKVRKSLQPYGPADRDTARRIINRSRQQYPAATLEDILLMVKTKAAAITRNAASPLAVLVVAVPKGFEGYSPPKPKTDPYEEQNIKLWWEMLAPGSKAPLEHQEVARRCLRERKLL